LKYGVNGLQRVRERLSYSKSQQAAQELSAVEATLEPIASVLVRDHVWAQRSEGWPARVQFVQTESEDERYEAVDASRREVIRLLACDLAVRCFVHKHGNPPERLEELVPEFLSTVPLDPFTDRPLIDRRRSDGFLLYSTGPDKTDNGGVSAKSELPSAGEDLVLAAPAHSAGDQASESVEGTPAGSEARDE
jgi:hypothetical protein